MIASNTACKNAQSKEKELTEKPIINLILLGPPGCGKGTQAKRMEAQYDLTSISTGELFRAEIAAATPLGKLANMYISKGQLCPDSVTLKMLYDFIQKHERSHGFIFDGVPRTINQAEIIDKMTLKKHMPLCQAVYFDVEEEELIRRILYRSQIAGRADDNRQIAHLRIAEYYDKTHPLVEYFEKQNRLMRINGMQTEDEVFAEVCRNIDAFMASL